MNINEYARTLKDIKVCNLFRIYDFLQEYINKNEID